MIKIKNNKGISLASVLVTLILMLIILTSIVYSNARTNEIKKAMLINSDIEELTKKVEVYYLEKETLPIIEDDESIYLYHEDKDGDNDIDEGEIVYYRLQISWLDNVTLNNKENIKNGTTLDDVEQWYVINKETHTIYFVKSENKQVKLQKAKYSENYADIINRAANSEKIIFSKEDSTGTVSVGNTTISAGKDELIEDTTSINIGTVEGEVGNNEGPTEVAGSGTAKYTYANYIGWDSTGTTATNLVLQYDGESNAGKNIHSSSATTWVDLTGNNNNCTFKNNNFSYKYNDTENYYTDAVDIANFSEDTYLLTFDSSKSEDGDHTTLKYDLWSKASDKTMNFGEKNISLDGHNNGFYAKPSLQFDNNNSYTIEMVFNYTGIGNIYLYDFGNLYSSEKKTGDYYNGGFLYDYVNYTGVHNDRVYLVDEYNTANGIASDWTLANDEKFFPLSEVTTYTLSNTDKQTAYNNKDAFLTSIDNKLKSSNYTRNVYIDGTNLYIKEESSTTTISLSNLKKDIPHTLTIIYNASTSKILVYIDGNCVNNSITKSATWTYISSRIGLFANNVYADILYVDQYMNGKVCASATGAGNIYSGPFDSNNRALFRCKYTNTSTNNFYSVRIYNRTLTNAEIKYNYITDYYRFGSGA